MSARPQTRSLTRNSSAQRSHQPPVISSRIPFRSRKLRKIETESPAKNVSACSHGLDRKSPISEIEEALILGKTGDEDTLILSKPGNEETPIFGKSGNEEALILSKRGDEETVILTKSSDDESIGQCLTGAVKLTMLIKPLSTDGEIECSLRHLRNSDPLLRPVIDAFQPPSFVSSRPPFVALIKSIVYQQLSTKAGKCIYTRFISLFETEANVKSSAVLSISAQKLREIGISGRKASYMHDLARIYEDGSLSDEMIWEMDDERMLERLTMVKGIGPWTVHMFMIFSLHRPDVLPVGDLGVRKGVQMLYKLSGLPDAGMMEKLCEKWKPYRSVGSWYMWRFVEAKGVLAL